MLPNHVPTPCLKTKPTRQKENIYILKNTYSQMIHDMTIPIRSYLNTAPNGVRIISFSFYLKSLAKEKPVFLKG